MKESILQKVAKNLITYKHGGYLQRAQSGKVRLKSVNKEGKEKTRGLNMAEKGTPDMVGFIPVQVTPAMVGKTLAVFV
jgi:ribosomal protein S19